MELGLRIGCKDYKLINNKQSSNDGRLDTVKELSGAQRALLHTSAFIVLIPSVMTPALCFHPISNASNAEKEAENNAPKCEKE